MYEQQILKILSEVGERGISVGVLSKHIYNMNTSLFCTLDPQEVRLQVQQYLLRNSKSPQSLIEATGKRGYYRLNTSNSPDARQLMLDFRDEEVQESEQPIVPTVDLSLNLFDE